MYARSGSTYAQLTDEKLITLVTMNQQLAFTTLMHRYERLVASVVQRYISDPEAVKEVVQDTFLRAYRALPDFQGKSKFSTWLYKIAISAAISRIRTRRYAAWQPIEEAMEYHSYDQTDHALHFEKQDTYSHLKNAMRRLDQHDAIALELFYLREQSLEEIVQLTGWTTSKTKSRLCRARTKLREVLSEA